MDIYAQIHVLPFQESGRTTGNNIKIDRYLPIFKCKDKLNDVFLLHETKELLRSDEVSNIGINFKFPSLQIGRLSVNDKFELTEGSRTIIIGHITKIENTIMNKSQWELNLSKSIESLEKEIWKEQKEYPSTLVEKCHRLRKKPISSLSNENLRLLLSQKVGITHTAPLIVKKLIEDKFIECDYYPGDLLVETFRKLDAEWGNSNFLKDEITFFVRHRFHEIKGHVEIPEKVKREIFDNLVDYENSRNSTK